MKRPFFKRLWDFLGSRDLSVLIFVMGMAYFFILLIFAMVIPLPNVHNISKLLPYKVLYLLFFLNLIICEIKWIPVIVRRCRRPEQPKTEEDLQRFGHKIAVSRESLAVSRLEKYMRRRGYKVESGVGRQEARINPPQSPPNLRGEAKGTRSSLVLYAYKGRFSPVGNILFHAGFFFLLIGAMLSLFLRFEGTVSLMEGQRFDSNESGYLSSTASRFVSPPDISFEVRKIIPTFWLDKLLFTNLEAEITHGGGKGVARLSKPVKISGARVTIIGMGITPEYVLRDGEGREIDSGYANLNIFVPGSRDWFEIPNTPFRVRLSFFPDFEVRGQKIFTRSMNPVNPVFGVQVFRGERMLYDGYLKPGEEANFTGMTLSFPSFEYGGLFKVVYDKGFAFIWTGFILMIISLMYRLMVCRKEILVYEEDGKTFIAGFSEYYRRLFDVELLFLITTV